MWREALKSDFFSFSQGNFDYATNTPFSDILEFKIDLSSYFVFPESVTVS